MPKIESQDINEVTNIINCFKNQIKVKKIKNKSESKTISHVPILTLMKFDYIKTKDNFLFIKKVVCDKIKSKMIKIDTKNSINLKGETYFKFIGNLNLIKII